jgi:hypothetical protein
MGSLMSLWARGGERGKCKNCESWRRIDGTRIGRCSYWGSIESGSYSCYRWSLAKDEKMDENPPANEDHPEDAR